MRKAHMMLPCTFGLLILVGSCLRLGAQVGTGSGDLDATFGPNGNGLVVTNVAYSDVAALAIETVNGVQFIVAAVQLQGPSTVFGVARYNMNGTLDSTFNGSGIVTNVSGYIYGLAVQSDGKILICGDSGGGTLLRLNTDGSPDTSFGSAGQVLIPNSKKSGSVGTKGIQVQNDGKIVVGGNVGSVGVIWRFLTNGALDSTFGSGGMASIQFGSGSTFLPRAIALQPATIPNGTAEQMIVAGANTTIGKGKSSEGVFAVVRLTPSGQMDTTFGSGGVTSNNFPGIIFALTIDSSSRIVAVGEEGFPNGLVAAARYSTNGNADTSFGSNGYTSFPVLSGSSEGYAVALQSDGKIVIGGPASNAGNPDQMFVARLTTAGGLDGNFGTGGYAIPSFSSLGYNEGFGYAVLVQPADGKIVLGGTAVLDPNPEVMALARYMP